jgi:hypothetical protein
MKCQNHPNREGKSSCSFCGKILCKECELKIMDKIYCYDCASELISVGSSVKKSNLNKDDLTNSHNAENEQIPNDSYSDERMYDYTHDKIHIESKNALNEVEKPLSTYQNTPSNPVEKKYEKYLDDLYYDEKNSARNNTNIPLNEQLANYEKNHGSLVKESPYLEKTVVSKNKDTEYTKYQLNESKEYKPVSLHKIHYKKEENSSNGTSFILSAILIVLVILVVSYILFLLFLKPTFPNYFDAMYAFISNPGIIFQNP